MKSLRLQLLLSHLALVVMVAVALSGAAISFLSLGQRIDDVSRRNFPALLAAQDLDSALNDHRVAALVWRSGDAANAITLNAAAQVRAERDLRELEPLMTTEDERDAYRIAVAGYQRLTEMLLRIGAEESDAARRAAVAEPLEAQISAVRTSAAAIAQINERQLIEENQTARQTALMFAAIGAAVTILSFLAGLYLARRMIQKSLTPLAIIARHAETLGSGDLSAKLEIPRKDEIGSLADSVNEMATRLAELQRDDARRLERLQRMSDAALDSLYDPVVVTDAKMRIVQMNQAATEVFGPVSLSPRVFVGDHIPDRRIVSAIEDAVDDARISAAEDESAFVTKAVGAGSKTFRIRVTPMRGEDNKVLGAVAVLEDVTRLRELDRMKTDFIGVAAHELRTPVASLLLSTQLLDEGAVGDVTEGQREIIRMQREDLHRLEKLTRDLLDVTRLESGTMPPRLEKATAQELVDVLGQTMRGIAEQKGVALRTHAEPGLPELRVDRSQVGRVLINLTNNAIRHTPPGGHVNVTASRQGDQVSFQVQDSGEGIPREYLQRIFERFVQVPGATQGGAGLGLSIAERIVKNHGGAMTVESEVGKGATFTFTIPIPREPEDESARATALAAVPKETL